MTRSFVVRIKASTLAPQISPFNFRAGDWEIGRAIFAPLLRFDGAFRLQPHLLTSWALSADKRRVVFSLRDDLVFHNGRPVDARDLAFSLERGSSPGARASFRELLADVARIEVLDDLAVAVDLERPNRMFPMYFTRAALSIVPREELRDDDPWRWRSVPVGCGPYRVADRSEQHVHLTAHAEFFARHAESPTDLVFERGPANGLDLIIDDTAGQAANYTRVEAPFWSTIAVEHYSSDAADPDRARELRRFINRVVQSLDVAEAMTARGLGTPARCFVPPAFFAFQPEIGERAAPADLVAEVTRRWGTIPPLWNVLYEGYGADSLLYGCQRELGARLRDCGVAVEDHRTSRLDLELPPGVHAFVLAASSFNYPDCDNLTLYFARGGDIHRASTPELVRLRGLLERGRQTAASDRVYHEALRLIEREGWVHPLLHAPEYCWVRRGFLDTATIYGASPHPFFEDLRRLDREA